MHFVRVTYYIWIRREKRCERDLMSPPPRGNWYKMCVSARRRKIRHLFVPKRGWPWHKTPQHSQYSRYHHHFSRIIPRATKEEHGRAVVPVNKIPRRSRAKRWRSSIKARLVPVRQISPPVSMIFGKLKYNTIFYASWALHWYLICKSRAKNGKMAPRRICNLLFCATFQQNFGPILAKQRPNKWHGRL